jgi:hypothetical protein
MSCFLQPISVLDELYQSVHEARRRRAVYDIVVEGDRQIEHVAQASRAPRSRLACE